MFKDQNSLQATINNMHRKSLFDVRIWIFNLTEYYKKYISAVEEQVVPIDIEDEKQLVNLLEKQGEIIDRKLIGFEED